MDLLLGQAAAAALRRRLAQERLAHAPHLIDPEVMHALRRLSMHGGLSDRRAADALADFAELPIVRHPHRPLNGEVWSLRERFSAYDALYVALARSFGAELVTSDAALARSARSVVAVAE